MRMKICHRMWLTPLPLLLLIVSVSAPGTPARADSSQNPEIVASDRNDVVIKVGSPIIVKDKKPAPPTKKK